MNSQFYNLRFYIVLATDFLLFAVAFVGAYLLRFDFILTPYYQIQIARMLPILLPGKILDILVLWSVRGYVALHRHE